MKYKPGPNLLYKMDAASQKRLAKVINEAGRKLNESMPKDIFWLSYNKQAIRYRLENGALVRVNPEQEKPSKPNPAYRKPKKKRKKK